MNTFRKPAIPARGKLEKHLDGMQVGDTVSLKDISERTGLSLSTLHKYMDTMIYNKRVAVVHGPRKTYVRI